MIFLFDCLMVAYAFAEALVSSYSNPDPCGLRLYRLRVVYAYAFYGGAYEAHCGSMQ